MFRVFAVLPAAGSSERMDMYPPKQFQLLNGKPVISYTIDAFENIQWVEKVIVAIAVDEFDRMRKLLKTWGHSQKVILVPGEPTRHGSIYNCIKYMESGHNEMPPDIVIVHDGCRIFATDHDLNTIATEAFKNGAAGYFRPSVSTVISKDKEGFLVDVFDRSQCFASETPQAFKYELIKEAYESATKHDIQNGTECLLLVKKHCLGAKVKLLDGPEHLWKITYKKDIYAASGMIKERASYMAFIGDEKIIWRNLLHAVTKSRESTVCSTVSAIPRPTIQNIILCYQNFNVHSLNLDTKDVVEYFSSNCMKNCTIIYVVASSDIDKIEVELRKHLREVAKQLLEKTVVVYGISTSKDPTVNTVGKAISSIIHDRNCDLSGQVFVFN